MVYLAVVFLLWIVSVFLIAFGGGLLIQYLQGNSVDIYTAGGSFVVGLLLNFLVVNWPVEKVIQKKGLDKKAVEALKYMAKVAPIAPKAVREGLEKIIERYS